MKDFLLLSSLNAITYKEFFPLLKDNNVRVGYTPISGGMDMYAGPNFDPEKKKVKYDENGNMIVNIEGIVWYTTLPTPDKRKLILTKKYKHTEYPHYDNYRAIEVSRIKDIPYNYECFMGVPITIFQYDLDNILVKNDQQPERPLRKKIAIRGIWKDNREEADFIVKGTPTYVDGKHKTIQGPVVNGKEKYARVVISLTRRKRS